MEMEENSLAQIRADIDYILSVSRSRPAAVDDTGRKVGDAIIRVFKLGYNGNHSKFPTEDQQLHRGRITSGGNCSSMYRSFGTLRHNSQSRVAPTYQANLFCIAPLVLQQPFWSCDRNKAISFV